MLSDKFLKIKISLADEGLKPNNHVAKDLRTPKYRMRTIERKNVYKRKEKYTKAVDFC